MKIIQNIFSTILIVLFFSGVPYSVFASQVDIADITVTPSEAPRAGDTVTVTMTASNPEGLPVYYKFYYCANYGTSAYATTPWTMVQDYSTSNTAQYTFNETGKYIIVVRAVTDPNNEPAALPIVGHVVDVGGTNDVTLTGLSKNPSTSATAGQTVQFTASAVTYLNDVIYYKFYYCANYGTAEHVTTPWTMIQDYSTSNICNVTFPASGDYIVVVRAVTDPNNEPAALPIVGQVVTVTAESSQSGDCGAYIAPGVWKEFDCYNLAAIGKTTGDDPFIPSWRLIGGYWQWGRKGPDSSQWYDTNTSNFAHGPTGPDAEYANDGEITGWDQANALDGSWSDASKTANDPCPEGFRMPTASQWDGVRNNNTQSAAGTWSSKTSNYSNASFFGSDLMLPAAGYRNHSGKGWLNDRGGSGSYWSGSESTAGTAWFLYFYSSGADANIGDRREGFSVRCIKDYAASQPDVLTLAKNVMTLVSGGNETVVVSGKYETFTVITSDSKVAMVTVTENGINIKGVSPGTATVTVKDNRGRTAALIVTVLVTIPSPVYCGANVAPGVWKQFDCYNLAAIGRNTSDDPFTPSWRLIGGYWQWGRKGPDPSDWYDTNMQNFAHGPTGPGSSETNEGEISGWDNSVAPNGAWSDSSRTANDPCSASYRVPTRIQWEGVIDNNTQSTVGTWSPSTSNYSSARFFGSDLMLPAAGNRFSLGVNSGINSGELLGRGGYGLYWSSSDQAGYSNAWSLYFSSGGATDPAINHRTNGFSVRCIAE